MTASWVNVTDFPIMDRVQAQNNHNLITSNSKSVNKISLYINYRNKGSNIKVTNEEKNIRYISNHGHLGFKLFFCLIKF